MAVAFAEMVNQSIQVITKPSIATFENFEKRGGVRDGAILMAAAAAVAGLFGLSDGIGGLVAAVIVSLALFFVFAGLVFYIGKMQGGSGSFDEVVYSFALFGAPLTVLGALVTLIFGWAGTLIVFAQLAANVYFAYMAIQSSHNLTDSSKIWTTLIGAVLGYGAIFLVLSLIVIVPLMVAFSNWAP